MVVAVKPGVRFARIAPAGFRILGAIERAARLFDEPLTITCACEAHPATDPHTTGEAYDVRTHGLTDDRKRTLLREILIDLRDDGDAPIATSGGLATRHFFGFLEAPNTANEHIHVQRRKGTTYP